jgi:hypothetical protein
MKRTIIFLMMMIMPLSGALSSNKKVKIKYRSHSQFDFSGDKVDGKIRGAAVFYIFQRKRSQGSKAITPIDNFDHHYGLVKTSFEKELKK